MQILTTWRDALGHMRALVAEIKDPETGKDLVVSRWFDTFKNAHYETEPRHLVALTQSKVRQ